MKLTLKLAIFLGALGVTSLSFAQIQDKLDSGASDLSGNVYECDVTFFSFDIKTHHKLASRVAKLEVREDDSQEVIDSEGARREIMPHVDFQQEGYRVEVSIARPFDHETQKPIGTKTEGSRFFTVELGKLLENPNDIGPRYFTSNSVLDHPQKQLHGFGEHDGETVGVFASAKCDLQ